MLSNKNAGSRPSAGDVIVALLFGTKILRNIVASVVFLGLAALFVRYAAQTRFFGVFTIVKYPYYSKLVGDIVTAPAFVRRIGSPIVVDDAGVWCERIDVGAQTSQCSLPVKGPLGSGLVFAQAQASGRDVHADLTLQVGDASDHVVVAH